MIFRTTTASDLDRVLSAVAEPSVNTTTAEVYTRNLELGSYRPEWTWVAADGDTIRALAVWWGPASWDHPGALDALWADPAVPDPVPLWTELIEQQIRQLPADAERPEHHLFLPRDWRMDAKLLAQLSPRLAAVTAAGLTETTERLRYQWHAFIRGCRRALTGSASWPNQTTRPSLMSSHG